jgi:PGF-CTERM protein
VIALEELAAALEAAETAEPTEDQTDDTPGFGIGVASIALLSAALLARRFG